MAEIIVNEERASNRVKSKKKNAVWDFVTSIASKLESLDVDLPQLGIITVGLICMGAALGFERSLLPRMAVQVFGVVSSTTVLNFVSTFGAAKATANVIAGPVADRFGRKPALALGFLVGLPVMPYVNYAETWTGITVMNVAFGLSQGLLGSALFFLLIDVMGPSRRGIAVGMGECIIYVSTAVVNVLAGDLASRYGYRPVPFWVATVFAVVGLVSVIPLRDTLDQVKIEQSQHVPLSALTTKESDLYSDMSEGIIESRTSLKRERQLVSKLSNGSSDISEGVIESLSSVKLDMCSEPTSVIYDNINERTPLVDRWYEWDSDSYTSNSLDRFYTEGSDSDEDVDEEKGPAGNPTALRVLAEILLNNSNFVILCVAGMAMNFKDGFAWGSFPIFFSEFHNLSDDNTDMLVAIYPLCWGFAQAFTGALSDRYGRKLFLLAGFGACTVAAALFSIPGYVWGRPANDNPLHIIVWIVADVCLGFGTAMAYPALQAGVADEIEPVNRGLGLGFYRFVRDMGYVVGALVCGRLTDGIGYPETFLIVSGVLGASLLLLWFFYTPLHWSERMWQTVSFKV